MKKYQHFPHYTSSLINNARRLRKEMTDAERKLWSRLRKNQLQFHFRRQVPFDHYILDFFCSKANLVIEIDGGQHYTDKGIERDQVRDAYLKENGLRVLRFSNRDIYQNIDGVLQTVYEHLKSYMDTSVLSKETPP